MISKRYQHRHYKSWLAKIIATLNITNVIVISALILLLVYGTLGTYILRSQFSGIHTLTDAFYYTVVVFSTLGDNRMEPETADAKYLVMSMVLFGFGAFATFVSVIFYQIVLRINKIVHKLQGGKVHMKDHVILCGYSVITELVINKFLLHHTPFLLLDNAQHPELNAAENGNFKFVSVPSRLDNLHKANIELCKMVIASSDLDSENILVAINANKLKKQYNAKFKIVIRVLYEENIEIANISGATDVISPTLMAATAILGLI